VQAALTLALTLVCPARALAASASQAQASPAPSSAPTSSPTTSVGVINIFVWPVAGKLFVWGAADPAAAAGIKRGDIVESIDGVHVTTAKAVLAALRIHLPGEHVSIVVRRAGVDRTIDVVTVAPTPETRTAILRAIPTTIGAIFATRNGPAVIRYVYDKYPAAKAGLKEGDIIVSVDGAAVSSAHMAYDAIARIAWGKHGSLGVIRDGSERTVDVAVVPMPPKFPITLNEKSRITGGTFTTIQSTDARMVPTPPPDAPIVVLDKFGAAQPGLAQYGLTVENVSKKTATHILFLIEMVNPFDTILESHAFVLSGLFSPGVLIDGAGKPGAPSMDGAETTSFNSNRPWFQLDNRHGPLFTRWIVRVVKVAFADGSVWQAGGAYPLIMPPPLPVAATATERTTTTTMGLGFSLESLCTTPRC